MNETSFVERASSTPIENPQLPAILMATASVLVDATFRRELYRDRIWTQLIIWLAASLQQTSSSETLIHSVFACSILSSTYVVLALRWSFLWSLPDYTRILAPSMLVALIHDTFTASSSSIQNNHSWVVFMILVSCLSGWKWYSNQREQRRRDLVGMPIVMSQVNLSNRNLDESHWSKWTRSQVLQWIASLDDDWRNSVCSLLAPEGITGSVLRAMTTEDLRSMGISYGDARRLVDHIQLLVSKYPDRNYCHRADNNGLDILDRWLGDKPQQRSIYLAQQPTPSVDEIGGFNEEALEKAKKTMQEKFGFELPELRAANGIGEQPSDTHESVSRAALKEDPCAMEASTAAEELPEVNDLPSNLLAAMPEHIREIAMRKPELITELLTTHRNESKGRDPPDPERIRRLIQESVPPIIVHTEVTIPSDYEDDEETTTLLRKRVGNTKYASIR